MMEHLSIKNSNWASNKDFERIGDLQNVEGPLLILFKKKDGGLYLFDWVDNDNCSNRWLVFKIDTQSLLDYIAKRTSYFTMFNNQTVNKQVFVADVLDYNNYAIQELENLPIAYQPDVDVFFNESDAVKLDKIKETLKRLHNIIENVDRTNMFRKSPTTTNALKVNSSWFPNHLSACSLNTNNNLPHLCTI